MKMTHTDANIGNIQINRTNALGTRLVGSTIPADTFITLTIGQGEVTQDKFNRERITPRTSKESSIVKVAMTTTQWGELVSSVGIGSGVPCTIERRDGKLVEQTYTSEQLDTYYQKRFEREAQTTVQGIKNAFEEAEDLLLNKKTINKTDRSTILMAYNTTMRLLTDSLPFLEALVAEDVEQQLADAQAQFKANVLHLSNEYQKQQNLLEANNNKKP